jgi:plastocyanin
MGIKVLNRSASAALALAVVLMPTAVGATATSADAAAAQTFTVLVGSQTTNMAVQGERFLPGDVTIDAGDTVQWKANSAEIHTVTFLHGGDVQTSLPPFTGDPSQVQPSGGPTLPANSTTDYNSGILVMGAPDYSLTFPNAGTYTYYCLVHGIMMRGVVHVQDPGAAYPYSQADYNAQAAFEAQALAQHGRAQMAKARAASTNHRVFTGTDDLLTMTMRFSRHKIVVHKGDTVTFKNTMSKNAPHTVTFGKVPLNFFPPSGHPDNYRGGNLNSGFMTPGMKFKVTFNKVGRFHYVCALHHDMGMKALVVVKP